MDLLELRLIGFAILTLLVGCASTSQTVSPAVATITFLPEGPNWQSYEVLAEAFNAQHPTIHVTVLNPADFATADPTGDPLDRVADLFQAADVILYLDLDASTLARSGLVQDLAPLFSGDDRSMAGDFYPTLLERYQGSAGLWGLPLNVIPRMLMYDDETWRAHHLLPPDPTWGWEAFLGAAQTLTDAERGTWGFVDSVESAGFLDFMHLNGAHLVSNDVATFSDALAVEALSWYVDLARQYHVMPIDENSCGTSNTCWGAAEMWIEPSTTTRADNPAQMPLPLGHLQGRYGASVSTLYLSARTLHPQASWAWMRFLTQQLPAPGTLPVRRSVFTFTNYQATLVDETRAAYAHILTHLTPSPARYPWMNDALLWLAKTGVPAVLDRQRTAQAVLDEAQAMALAAQQQSAQFVAPSAPEMATATPPAKTTVEVVAISGQNPAIEELAQVFEDTHPGIRIRLKHLPTGPHTFEELAESADVISTMPVACGVRDQLFLDLFPLLEEDSGFARDDFYPLTLEAFQCEGRLYALPQAIDARMLAYNRALFDAADEPYPSPDWTWDDLLVTAGRLTRHEAPAQWGFTLTDTGWYELPIILTAQRLEETPGTGDANTLLSSPHAADVLQWWLDLVTVYGVMPLPIADGAYPAGRQMFREGRAAMIVAPLAGIGVTAREIMDIGVIALPVTGQPATYFDVHGYSISAQTEHPQEAWRWVEFLSRQTNALGVMPARRSLSAETIFRQDDPALQGEIRTAYATMLERYQNAAVLAQAGGDPYESDVLQRTFVQAAKLSWNQDDSVTAALRDAQERFAGYLACVEARKEESSAIRSEKCAEEIGIPGWQELLGLSD